MKTMIQVAAAILLITGIAACKKENGTGAMTVHMKDNPIPFDNVFVEVLQVQVHHDNGQGGGQGWINLNTDAGVYDLLTLQNGVFTTLSDSVVLPAGHYNQMRLILGTANSVVVDSVSYPLLLSSQDETGLKFNLNATVQPNDDVEVLFDFDAQKSVILQGNGSYRLKPVLKVESIVYQ